MSTVGVSRRPRHEWSLKRNCALSPRQLVKFYLTLVVVSLLIGIGFAGVGAWFVLPFAGLDMAAVGIAFVIYARHAADHEHVILGDEVLVVRSFSAGRSTETTLNPYWVRVVVRSGVRVTVFLEERGSRIPVGRHVDDNGRKMFAQELKRALVRV